MGSGLSATARPEGFDWLLPRQNRADGGLGQARRRGRTARTPRDAGAATRDRRHLAGELAEAIRSDLLPLHAPCDERLADSLSSAYEPSLTTWPRFSTSVRNAHGGPKRRLSTCVQINNCAIRNANVPYTHTTSPTGGNSQRRYSRYIKQVQLYTHTTHRISAGRRRLPLVHAASR